jgi:glycosyltransferase involved in cell wall biosynthesis
MRRQVTRAGLERNVTFLGQVAEESLRERLLQSHLLVVPSSYEGFGIVYLEGMGYGLPAIGTDAGAAGEVITHLENGYLITPGDFHALAEHIRTLDQDRFTLEKMGLAAIRHYARHPSWDEMGRSIRGFLESVVNTDYPWLANY